MDSGGHRYDKKTPNSNLGVISMRSICCDDCDGNTMSRVTEMIDVDLMIGRTLIDGKIVAEFKCGQCDQCQRIEILDRAGYQRDVSGEPILWFCGQCRK
jgi:hypothetical protein